LGKLRRAAVRDGCQPVQGLCPFHDDLKQAMMQEFLTGRIRLVEQDKKVWNTIFLKPILGGWQNMSDQGPPKVYISYCWSPEEHQTWVIQLAAEVA